MMTRTLGLTFDDYIVRVAEFLGIAYYGANGSETAQNPTDAHDLDLCKRLVNDGWRRFVNSNAKWNWLFPVCTITFDPDGNTDRTVESDNDTIPRSARYHMPAGFYGMLEGPFAYPPAGPRIAIDEVPEVTIREYYAGAASTTGDPYIYAIRPLPAPDDPGDSQSSRWEAIFFPTPDSELSVSARCRIYPTRLVEGRDRHNAGIQYDEAVLAAVMAEAEMQRHGTAGVKNAYWAEALTRAIAFDQSTGPKKLGYVHDRSDEPDRLWPGHPYYTGVDTYNGNAV